VSRVIAALDNNSAAQPVVLVAQRLAEILGDEVDAVHVRDDGDRIARGVAQAASLELHEPEGPVVDTLVRSCEGADVDALVLGARKSPGGHRPLGGTAFAVATTLAKPVVIVPPDATAPGRLDRVLVPLEASVSSSLAPRAVIALAREARLEVVVLHVHEEESLPAFTDQPQHEERAWAEEFLARYCPSGLDIVELDVRVGRSEELVPLVAEECGADLIALGWSQVLAEQRAPVVRATLARARVPVMLIPVELVA
jgi:nucleotide-binding universal stress UspA family protein